MGSNLLMIFLIYSFIFYILLVIHNNYNTNINDDLKATLAILFGAYGVGFVG